MLREDYTSAPAAARELGLDKSHLCTQLRAGKFPGAFQFDAEYGGGRAPWVIPRVAVAAYRETHLTPDHHRKHKKTSNGVPSAD
jgi:hypothetical protein